MIAAFDYRKSLAEIENEVLAAIGRVLHSNRLILGPETELLGEQRVTRSRIFTYDELDILGKAQEEDMLREALAREIAGVITRRLAGLAE